MMRYEIQLEADETSEKFKANLFASNPELYYELFEKKDNVMSDGPDNIDFPESEAEFKAMIASMQREGFVDRYDRIDEVPPEETSTS